MTQLDKIIEIDSSVLALHYAMYTDRRCVPCEYNKTELVGRLYLLCLQRHHHHKTLFNFCSRSAAIELQRKRVYVRE